MNEHRPAAPDQTSALGDVSAESSTERELSWGSADGWPFWTDRSGADETPAVEIGPVRGGWLDRFKIRAGLRESPR